MLAVALVNGLAEELFFRGAVYAAVGPRHRMTAATVVYVVATAATGNLALVLAAAAMGVLLTSERRATGGTLAPITTHLLWSTLMILFLPR